MNWTELFILRYIFTLKLWVKKMGGIPVTYSPSKKGSCLMAIKSKCLARSKKKRAARRNLSMSNR